MGGTKTVAKLARVVVDIRPGQASVARKEAWKRFWQKLIMKETDRHA